MEAYGQVTPRLLARGADWCCAAADADRDDDRGSHAKAPPTSQTHGGGAGRSAVGVPPSDVDMPVERCRGLIAEALTIRERMSGQIDAETYQARMKDLAWQASREGRAHRNAR